MEDYSYFTDYPETDYGNFLQDNGVEDIYSKLEDIVAYFKSQPYYENAMKLYIEQFRKLPIEIAKELDAFAVPDEYEEVPISAYPEWMREWSLGFVRNKHMVFSGRCVFPIKNAGKRVIGFVGWDPFVTPKYLDSMNSGYKAKSTTFFGMEKIEEYYRSKEPVFLTEGLMCTAYLRSKKFQALASLGSALSKYQIEILKRFGDRLIIIPDNDEAGYKFVDQSKRMLKKARVVTVTHGKDIDGCRKDSEGIYEENLLSDLVNAGNPFTIFKELVLR